MGLRNCCHLIYDEFQKDGAHKIEFKNQVAFVKTDLIHEFFELIEPNIKFPFKLITHNSAYPINASRGQYVYRDKLTEWFAQNVNIFHQKLKSIPLSIMNARWKCGDTQVIDRVKNSRFQKTHLLYCNFDTSTNPNSRNTVHQTFVNQDFVLSASRKPFEEYLIDLKSSHYVLSPNGRGVDCHRLWETLLMGSIPVVENSINISFYKHLPILIIDDWQQVNEQFLREKLDQFQNTTPQECYLDYWIKKIGLKNIKNTV